MIHNNIPKPELSPNFTMEDIHKIRAWNYERRKDATRQEILDDIHQGAAPVWARLEQLKAAHHAKTVHTAGITG